MPLEQIGVRLVAEQKDAYIQAMKDAGKATQNLGDDITKTSSFSGKAVAGLSSIGGGIVLGALAATTTAVTGLVAGLISSIGPASDLNETTSKIGIVFGEAADQILKMGDSAASALGMSKNEALSAAGVYGNLFRAMGIGEQTSADMSVSLVGLAADLASFNNMDPTEVLDKLRAGLSGETEPLRTLGVNLNQVQIEAKAMELGLLTAGGTLTAAAKAQASYALILEQTALAQGDFIRTSEGLANQQRIIKATFADLKTQVGQKLLPVIAEITNKLSKFFQSADFKQFFDGVLSGVANLASGLANNIPKVIATIKGIFEWAQNNKGVFVAALAAAGVAVGMFVYTTLIPAAIAAATAFAPALLVMGLVAGAAYLIYQAWTTNFGGIQDFLTGVWTSNIQPIFDQLRTWLAVVIPQAVGFLQNAWVTVLQPALAAVGAWMQGSLFPVLGVLFNWLGVSIPYNLKLLANTWTTVLWPAISAVWSWMSANLFPFLGALANLVGAVLGLAVRVLAGIWQNVLQPALESVWSWMSEKLLPVIKSVSGWISDHLTPAFSWLSTKIQAVADWISRLAAALSKIKLPGWMTPGSPTPWEVGLTGVYDQLIKLYKSGLPGLEHELSVTGNMGRGIGSGYGDARGVALKNSAPSTVVVDGAPSYALNMSTTMQQSSVKQGFDAMRLLA